MKKPTRPTNSALSHARFIVRDALEHENDDRYAEAGRRYNPAWLTKRFRDQLEYKIAEGLDQFFGDAIYGIENPEKITHALKVFSEQIS